MPFFDHGWIRKQVCSGLCGNHIACLLYIGIACAMSQLVHAFRHRIASGRFLLRALPVVVEHLLRIVSRVMMAHYAQPVALMVHLTCIFSFQAKLGFSNGRMRAFNVE